MKIMGKAPTTTTTTFAIRHAILLVGIMVSSSDGFSTYTLKQPPSPLQSSFEDYPSPAPDAANCPPDQPIPPPDLGPAPEGYVGGYAESNPNFAYPTTLPDLSSITMTTNLANIAKLTRQQKIKWPEFTWLSILGDPTSRLYLTFPDDISRMGYDDEGKVWSIICPQLGAYTGILGELNIEVTVTGVRGWTKETKDTERSSCIDIGVMVQFWLSSDDQTSPFIKVLEKFMNEHAQGQLPFEKSKAIQIATSERNNPRQLLSRVSSGMSPDISVPLEKQHWDEAYAVINLSIQINQIKSDDDQLDIVTDFNQLIIDIFNIEVGNMMKPGNILSWNIWFQEPELVDKVEWKTHAERYRKSVDVRRTTSIGPTSQASDFTNFNGVAINPVKDDLRNEIELIKVFFAKHVNGDDLAKYKHLIDLAEFEYKADKALKKIKKIL